MCCRSTTWARWPMPPTARRTRWPSDLQGMTVMNWFHRMKLAHKLLASFLLCSVLTALVGGYSLSRLSELGGMIHTTYVDNVLPLQDIAEAEARLTAHSRSYVRLPAM